MLNKFPPAPPVASTFVQAALLAAQLRSEQYQRDANESNTFGTQENSDHPQRVTLNERMANVTTFETEYQDFNPLKHAIESVFVETWDLYTKQVTYNLITQLLHNTPLRS